MNFKVPIPGFLKSVKYTLGFANIAYAVTGLLLLLAGITVLVINTRHDVFITSSFLTIPSFSIATGVIILLISVLGFYAAYSKQFYFVAGFALLMVVTFIFDLALVIVSYQLSNNAAAELRPVMLESLRQYLNSREVAQQWDDLQNAFQCCGAVNRFDWASHQVPISCCFIDYGTISPFQCNTTVAYTTGCTEALGNWLSYNMFVLAVCALVVTCIQTPITFIAVWLGWRSKSEIVELES